MSLEYVRKILLGRARQLGILRTRWHDVLREAH